LSRFGIGVVRSADVQKLAVIGEAAGRVAEELEGRNGELPWPQIIAFRNILVHAHFGIDWDIVWRGRQRPVSSFARAGHGNSDSRVWWRQTRSGSCG
jgi:uncharacterized protein with HEPN domain